ncbi:cupin domain-containing protein [Paracoccus aminovorans]|uniref:hypothetical protein n=1 Tax=Paracoccus aminovorans TaxID=34004 RepID=UPI002B257017|nr:hypothetical protein [Paracoccus aminovorans]
MTDTDSALDLNRFHLHLDDGPRIRPVSVASKAGDRPAEGRTLAVFSAERPEDLHPEYWEMHPGGDELLIACSGRLELDIEDAGGIRTVELTPRTGQVVPAGLWHRLRLLEPAVLMALTHRNGTQRRKDGGA